MLRERKMADCDRTWATCGGGEIFDFDPWDLGGVGMSGFEYAADEGGGEGGFAGHVGDLEFFFRRGGRD